MTVRKVAEGVRWATGHIVSAIAIAILAGDLPRDFCKGITSSESSTWPFESGSTVICRSRDRTADVRARLA